MDMRAFFSRGYESNVYFIKDKKSLMIDAGTFPDGIKPDILLLTHCHFDHIEKAKEVQERTGCEIWMSRAEADFFEKSREDASASKFFGLDVDIDFKIDKRINDKDTLDLGTTKLETLLTPGHTPGGMCLYEPKSKSLFSGDTIFSSGFGRYDLLGGDVNALKESIKKLSKLDVGGLYPAHGPPLKSGVKEYIKSIRI